MSKNNLYFKSTLVVLILMVICASAFGQVTSKDIETAVGNEWNTWKGILRIIVNAAIGIGGIILAAAYLTNRQESKDHLTKWVIGLVIAGIIRITVLT